MGLVAVVMRLWLVVMILVLLLGDWRTQCHGCWENERTALLQIRYSFNHSGNLHDYYMSRWGIDADCCKWYGVACNETTKLVTQLSLSSIMDPDARGWYLNASLFLPFKYLITLDLSENHILGCVENEGFEKLSTLVDLEVLRLSKNDFNKSIVSSLRNISSLKILDLSFNKIIGVVDIQDLNHLTSLEILHLQVNEIEGFKSFRGDDKEVLRLSNLQSLQLGHNNLDSSILSSLKGLSSLKQLDLNYNQLKGTINVKELNTLSQLEELHLSGNEITRFAAAGVINSKNWSNITVLGLNEIRRNASNVLELQSLLISFPNLNTLYLRSNNLRGTSFGQGSYNLTNLENLHLDDSSVDENFLQSLGALVSLQYLSMQRLNASQLTQGLCKLNQLQYLDISKSNFSGTLPSCMTNLTFLWGLDLSYNQFTGNITLCPLKNLTSLEFLDLSYNQFQIPMTLSPFFNHTKLYSFFARGNHIFSETEQHSLAPKLNLTKLSLSGYGYGGKFPKFLYYQNKLQYVDLSNIRMNGGGFPYWMLENNTDLETLRLANNSLSGQLLLPRDPNTRLQILDISDNGLHGHVPAQVGALLPSLGSLNMSGNNFSGGIPSSLVNMSAMVALDLSNNRLSGKVPQQLTTGLLHILVLSNNNLQGQIFPGNWQNLHSLQMNGNNFTGTIPDSLSNSSLLNVLDLSHNNLYGMLPQWIGNMSALEVLDLSENNISGSLPSNFPSSIVQVYLSKNRLQGSLENAFFNHSSLVMLDLSHNYFTGSIPKWVERLSNLSYLLLDNNNFKDDIPIQLCKLDKLRLIKFSYNYLSGHILSCLRTASTWDTIEITRSFSVDYIGSFTVQPPSAEFTTKSISYSYKGRLLSYMSGIDLSSNNFTGEIPAQFGNLSTIKVLNLSHNSLTGSIPSTFANLTEIESLDLSYNKLDGKIPPQLIQLHQIAVFTVAHNNLSGKIPEDAQFATFENRSYEGNPFLCGPPLTKSCNGHPSPPSFLENSGKHEEETGFVDMDAFYPTFLGSYLVVLLAIAAVLYINPHWRRAWFYFVEECINNCYYFIVDNLPILSRYRASQPCV